MAAGSAFSLLEEFYFFAAIAATSLLEHLVRCFSMNLLRLDLNNLLKHTSFQLFPPASSLLLLLSKY